MIIFRIRYGLGNKLVGLGQGIVHLDKGLNVLGNFLRPDTQVEPKVLNVLDLFDFGF